MYLVTFASSARKGLRKHSRAGTIKTGAFDLALSCLEIGRPLPERYKDHKLQGDLSSSRECHLGFDMLMIYRRNEDLRLVTIEQVGTHSELFGD